MSTSNLTSRIPAAAKILDPKNPDKAETLIIATLMKCDCDHDETASDQLVFLRRRCSSIQVLRAIVNTQVENFHRES